MDAIQQNETAGENTHRIEEMSPREIGCEGERLAARYLEQRDYRVVERNWRCPLGEVDIVSLDQDGTYVLVEVKTRLTLGDSDVMPELAVGRKKRERYRKLALYFLAQHPEAFAVRFDVIALNIVSENAARLRHLIGAFEWEE